MQSQNFSPWLEKHLYKNLKLMKIVWFSMLTTPFLLGYLLFFQATVRDGSVEEAFAGTGMQIGFAIALALFMVGLVLDRVRVPISSLEKLKREPLTAEALDSIRTEQGAPIYSERDIQGILALPLNEQLLFRLARGLYLTKAMIAFLLFDLCSAIGFMTVTGRYPTIAYFPFCALSLVGLVLVFPSREKIMRFARFSRAHV